MSIGDKYKSRYTYEEYYLWEGKWELIAGIAYAINDSFTIAHQSVLGNLYSAFNESFKNEGCENCKLYPPVDWKIADDTVVQPDLLIVFEIIQKDFLDFPPALALEVLSPSTEHKDRNEKMELYLSQKVKYYLIIDPEFKKVEVYQFINDQYEPVAVNPDSFSFTFEDDCTAEVNLLGIWD